MNKNKKDHFIDRLIEIFPGATTWFILISPLIFSLKVPFAVAIFILFLDLYWLYRSVKISIFSFIGYHKMKKAEETDWLEVLRQENSENTVYGETFSWNEFYHLLIIPTYKEPVEILEQNLEAIASQDFPHERIMVVVAMEEREGREVLQQKIDLLQQRFGKSFYRLFFPIHPADYPGHHPGPGSNRTFAMKTVIPLIQKEGLSPKQIILTTLDADFVIHPRFIGGLTHKYLKTPHAEKRSFTGIFWYYNNFWKAPVLNRMVASGVSFWQLSEMTGSSKYFNFSSHSLNLKSLIDMDFWVVDKVNDDGEFYWRAFYHFAGDYKVLPHFLPIFADAVQTETWWGGLKEQYLQLRRWSYGVEHMPMIIRQYFRRSDIPFFNKTGKVLFLIQGYLTWSTLAILITFGGLIIEKINKDFAQTVIAFNLPYFSSIILTVAILGLGILIIIHEKIVPERPKEWGTLHRIVSFLQWFAVPISILAYGSFPAIESQTRLMLGKYMDYRVTKKVRL